MKIIDSHIHFWDVANGFNEWVEETTLPKQVSPDHLNAEGFVHIEAHGEHHSPFCEFSWLKQTYPNCHIKVIAFIDFTLPLKDFERCLSVLSAQPDIVGVRQIMATTSEFSYNPFKKAIPVDLREKLSMLTAHDMIFEAQMYPNQFLDLLDDIKASDVTMTLQHMALPVLSSAENQSHWRTLLKEISHQKNWIIKLSGFEMLNKDNQLEACLDSIFEIIPLNQLCYGSNYPVTHPHDYARWQNQLCEYINEEDVKMNIFYRTANRLYFSGR
ncbi:amidohydrolase family protein [Alteromonas sp. ASW11-130]|uniref:amidohydrolase family protein n=1 Tax=Alteromonas sp. ASW11-130 TaxID=3015775 RepID=UPI0022428E10|nr:amidohydrolase family protein [Alteromonas sp. ASW11-130]